MLKDVGRRTCRRSDTVLWADSSSGGLEQTGSFEIDLYDDGYAGNDRRTSSGSTTTLNLQTNCGWNIGRWTIRAMIWSVPPTLDETERTAAFCEMATAMGAELPQILLFSTVNADAYSTRVQGVEANVNSVVSWNAADWTLTK
jgi:ABC-type transport system substrate-binding protein